MVKLFTRRGCHLCEDARRVILEARRHEPFEYVEVDIDSSEEWRLQYQYEVPVIHIRDEEAFAHRVTLPQLLAAVRAAR